MNHPDQPELLLGTAMWGWTIDKPTAFRLLDRFYESGFRQVDSATNYPIDKNPEHFRLSEKILEEWTRVNQITDLKIIMKVGSLDNMRSPDHNLSKSFLLLALDHYSYHLGPNLDTLMIHWDNRREAESVRESFEALEVVRESGLEVGLSGIRHPEVHAAVNREFGFDFRIQIKHNLLHSDYGRYQPFHGKTRFIAYGINAGGIKLEDKAYSSGSTLLARGGQPNEDLAGKIRIFLAELDQGGFPESLASFNQIGMIFAFYSPDMGGILLGPSGRDQLEDSINFYRHLQAGHYQAAFEGLTELIRN